MHHSTEQVWLVSTLARQDQAAAVLFNTHLLSEAGSVESLLVLVLKLQPLQEGGKKHLSVLLSTEMLQSLTFAAFILIYLLNI